LISKGCKAISAADGCSGQNLRHKQRGIGGRGDPRRGRFLRLVFHPKSPRNLSRDQAGALAAFMRGRSRLVALFADAGDEEIGEVVKFVRPDFLQLHGSETPERAGALRARFGIRSSRPWPSPMRRMWRAPRDTRSPPTCFCSTPEHRTARCGRAVTARRSTGNCSWTEILETVAAGRRIERGQCRPRDPHRRRAGVDVSSGVETAPGVKSPEMVSAFVTAARAATYAENRA